eukprot:11200755-Lingulodinium_polyedra.AAC.1
MAEGEGEPAAWHQAARVLAPRPEVRRLHCGGTVPVGRRAAFVGRRCPAWRCGHGDPPGLGGLAGDWGV